MTYREFLESKIELAVDSGFEVDRDTSEDPADMKVQEQSD